MNKQEKTAGLIAGISLLMMAIAAGFSYGFVQSELLVESAEISKQNILENSNLFYASIAGWLLIFITDLMVSFALYVFFKNTSKHISMVTASIRLVYTLILGAAIFQLFPILTDLSTDMNALDILGSYQSFEKIWSFGLIIFGIHLLGLAYLSLKSKTVPRFLGYLLYFAGAAYTLLHGAKQFSAFPADIIEKTEVLLSLPMGLSEILLAIWLIYRGFKRKA